MKHHANIYNCYSINMKLKLLSSIFILLFLSCKDNKKRSDIENPNHLSIINYAKGFTVSDHGIYKILKISNPWPNAERSYRYLLISNENDTKTNFNKDNYDGIIFTPVEKIVVTSTTHIPALELLGVENRLIGFPGSDYISSEKTRLRIDNGYIRELGKNESINTEVLLEIRPDVVVGYGVDGTSKSLNLIKKSNIPVIYNGDWVEGSALAKAEWIKFFGVLFNKEKKADSIFKHIENNYLKVKELASKAKNKPSVLSGAMHKDIWYLPNGNSSEAQLLKDANVNYLWNKTSGIGSLALSFETVFDKAKNADLWLSPSYYTSKENLEKANEHYTRFKAFKNNTIYTFSNTKGRTGGVLYYELGMARPDLVLKDIIKVCHPELLNDYQPYFFKPLK